MNLIDQEEAPTEGRLKGTVTEWNDARGFGWVEVEGKRRFAHIRDFGRTTRRPEEGDEVSFLPGKDPKGRDCATQLEFQRKSPSVPGMGLSNWVILFSLVLLPLLAGLKLTAAPWILAAWLVMASRMSWLQYSFDKERAQAGMARLRETTLLGADLVGGWPGGFVAQRMLRHKTRKKSYRFMFWLIVILWQWVAFEVIMGGVLTRAIKERIGG